MIAPRLTPDYPEDGQIVIVGACHEHVLPVRLWQEEASLDGSALVMEAATLSREFSRIFDGVQTPVTRLQHAV